MKAGTLAAIVFGGICIIAAAAVSHAEFELVPTGDPLYREIRAEAAKWKAALLGKKIDVLISYAPPESREDVKDALHNKKSDLYRLLYDTAWMQKNGGIPIHDILKRAKHLNIILQKDTYAEDISDGVDVFYFDEGSVPLKFPLSIKDIRSGTLQEMIDEGKLVYLVFFKSEDRWYVNYDLFEEDEEEEE